MRKRRGAVQRAYRGWPNARVAIGSSKPRDPPAPDADICMPSAIQQRGGGTHAFALVFTFGNGGVVGVQEFRNHDEALKAVGLAE